MTLTFWKALGCNSTLVCCFNISFCRYSKANLITVFITVLVIHITCVCGSEVDISEATRNKESVAIHWMWPGRFPQYFE